MPCDALSKCRAATVECNAGRLCENPVTQKALSEFREPTISAERRKSRKFALRATTRSFPSSFHRSARVSPEKRIEFRVGIHLGDVVEEADGDLMGDGVNIASRLEGVAEPNGICVSRAAYEQVRDKLPHKFFDLGEKQLKNIARPVHAYRVTMDRNPTNSESVAPENPTSRLSLPDKPSIAVLPFQNISGDPEQEYFADGIVEDIITGLSRTKSLFVIARNSSFTYKGRSFDVGQVGRELGVRYVLECSVRKAAPRLRITRANSSTMTSGLAYLRRRRFDGFIEQVFELQDQVTARVVATIEPALAGAEMERARTKPTASLTAYDCFLRALAALRIPTKPGVEEGLALCRQAITLDPNYASAYGVAAWCCMQRLAHGWAAEGDHVVGAEFARHADRVGGDDPTALSTAALALGMLVRVPGSRRGRARPLALMLNPNSAQALMFSSFVHSTLGDAQDRHRPCSARGCA